MDFLSEALEGRDFLLGRRRGEGLLAWVCVSGRPIAEPWCLPTFPLGVPPPELDAGSQEKRSQSVVREGPRGKEKGGQERANWRALG